MCKKDLPALIIFIRNPEKGKGKTRLAADVGLLKAFDIYLELLAITRTLAENYAGKRYLFYSEFVDQQDAWKNEKFTKLIQGEGPLGDKMQLAFEQVLTHHSAAIIVGSDCPYLSLVDLENAAIELKNADVVVGPAEDGGYYLLGMKKVHRPLFQNIAWSTSTTLKETLVAAQNLNLKVRQLRMLNDIDHLKDWASYQTFKANEQLL